MRPANERRRYIVTSSTIGWAHTQNDPCKWTLDCGVGMILICGTRQLFNQYNLTSDVILLWELIIITILSEY